MVADVSRMGEWSPECQRCELLGGATQADVGTRFRGSNRRKGAWRTEATVTEAKTGEVFAFAVSIDPPGDLNFERIGRKDLPGVVEREGDFGQADGTPRARPVEDDVGHLAAAERLGRLLAKNPLHRIDDVALARTVRPNDGGDSGRELEPRFLGERFEPDEFEPLQHGIANL